MVHLNCPWCEAELLGAFDTREEGQCPECLSIWEDEEEEVELAMAA